MASEQLDTQVWNLCIYVSECTELVSWMRIDDHVSELLETRLTSLDKGF